MGLDASAAWDGATPEHRGELFGLGHRLWERRGEVLLADARKALESVRSEAEGERARLRGDMAAEAAAWSGRLGEAMREAGARSAVVERLERELAFERDRLARELAAERARAAGDLADARASALALMREASAGHDAAVRDAIRNAEARVKAVAEAEASAKKLRVEAEVMAALRSAKVAGEADLRASKARLESEADAAVRAARVRADEEVEAVKARFASELETRLAAALAAKACVEAERDRLARDSDRLARDSDRLARENERSAAAIAALTPLGHGGSSAGDKGRAGEAAARDALARLYPGSVIVDKSATGACGDLWWTLPGRARPVLVEVKNYSGDLPLKEVEKFHRDVATNRRAVCGAVLACYRCPSVPTMPGKICFSFTPEGVPVVSVCEAEDNLVAALSAFVTFVGAHEVLQASNHDGDDFRRRLHEHLAAAHASAEVALKAQESAERSTRLSKDHSISAHLEVQKITASLRAHLDALRLTMALVGGAPADATAENSAAAGGRVDTEETHGVPANEVEAAYAVPCAPDDLDGMTQKQLRVVAKPFHFKGVAQMSVEALRAGIRTERAKATAPPAAPQVSAPQALPTPHRAPTPLAGPSCAPTPLAGPSAERLVYARAEASRAAKDAALAMEAVVRGWRCG